MSDHGNVAPLAVFSKLDGLTRFVAPFLPAPLLAGLAFWKQSREVTILVQENERQAAERRRAQAVSVYIGLPVRGIRLVQPSAQNAGGLPVFDAQFWYSGPDGLSDPDELGMIMPGPVGINGRQMRYEEAVQSAILTFRDAEGVRWIRMADGTLKEQTRATARESILAALGQSPPESGPAELPEAPDAPEAPESAGNPETPKAQ
jgi:hypothetical protein